MTRTAVVRGLMRAVAPRTLHPTPPHSARAFSSVSEPPSYLQKQSFVPPYTPAAARVLRAQPPAVVVASADERQAGRLHARNLERAIHALHHDGLVVVEDAVDPAAIDHLNGQMVHDARLLQARGEDGPFNYNTGNLQQDPPPVRDFFARDIFMNRLATHVTSTMLGPMPRWTFCSGNSAMPPLPGCEPQRQPVHSDADFAHPDMPFALVVNVPLIDFNEANGSTELWLGTHVSGLSGLHVQEGMHGERASGRIREHLVEQRRLVRPPVQPKIRKGSVVVRDLRLWHAGMPNYTNDVRVMLAMIHFAPWYRNPMRLELSESLREAIECETQLDIPVDYVSEHEALQNYLHRPFGNSYDFNQAA